MTDEGQPRGDQLPRVLLVSLALASVPACVPKTNGRAQGSLSPAAPTSSSKGGGNIMASDYITIRETTQPELSGHLVGVGNIFERELPDAEGHMARRMSASLTITAAGSQQSRWEKVFSGSVITLGADHYAVVQVEEGKSSPGSITLRKLPAGPVRASGGPRG